MTETNLYIDGNKIMRHGESIGKRIISEPKPIGDLDKAITSGIKTFDGFGSRTYMIMNDDELKDLTTDDSIFFYNVEFNFHNDQHLVILNFLKKTATPNMIAKRDEFHNTCIGLIADHLA